MIQINRSEFPTLFAIAMDYLPIQASSVPCEHVFSSAKETDTVKRNRIHPMLMEVLQMLKFSLKKDRQAVYQVHRWMEDSEG
jgi:hAT family C-terminal dimerisation region